MSSSISTVSRRLYRSLLSVSKPYRDLSAPFCSNRLSADGEDSDWDELVAKLDTDDVADSASATSSPDSSSSQERIIRDRPLENGLDVGVYKAILVGQAGQSPLQKKLRSGTVVTLLSLGTGGIRNNRRPLENENPTEYANRCAVQWHRVSVYPAGLGNVVMKHVVPGSILYVEGNLETKIFSDPITGLVRRIREVAIRRNGRLVFLGQGGTDAQKLTENRGLRAVGYY